jgi:pimeloyl-ACP methyl ester carboxylesterase
MDLRRFEDWWAALRWITRHVPSLDDKFRQVRANIHHLIEWLRDRFGKFRLVAVGHSLGGGLAQQAAYASGGFDEVVAFNPIFVTGWFETATEEVRRANAQNLHIFRVYEDGEILAFLWRIVEWRLPLARQPNPRITRIRTHFYSGFAPFQKHKIIQLSSSLGATVSLDKEQPRSSRELRLFTEVLVGELLAKINLLEGSVPDEDPNAG